MHSDKEARQSFLLRLGWSGAHIDQITGDASDRQYYRLTRANGETAVLMVTPTTDQASLSAFLAVNRHLQSIGLSPPDILGKDTVNGLVLLEDFGHTTMADRLEADSKDATNAYAIAIDIIVEMQSHKPKLTLTTFTAPRMAEATMLVLDAYVPACAGDVSANTRSELIELLNAALEPLDSVEPVFIHRDYHAENLMYLPDRTGKNQFGIIDHQDAMMCHHAYDLASILHDARRDVPRKTYDAMIARFASAKGLDADEIKRDVALIAVQRNLRILGIFARLARTRGKPHYISLMPRVWNHIQSALEHAALSDVAPIIQAVVPEPDTATRNHLRSQCQILP